jgi:hypothetical protein
MANGFSEIPIFVGTRTKDKWESFGDIDSTFFLLDFLLHVERNDLT